MDESIDEVWDRLEGFLKQNAPNVYDTLAPGATEGEISDVEEWCGVRFPADVRQSYLRHDGQADEGYHFIPGYFYLLPMSDVLGYWEGRGLVVTALPEGHHAGPGVKPVYLDPAWIPFAADIGGNRLCLDFGPAPGGVVGQVITHDHESDGQSVLASSFRTWLNGLVGDLEAGRLVWNEELEGYEYPEE